jgi:hypothetical protein
VIARILSAIVPGTLALTRRKDALGFELGDAVRLEHEAGLPRERLGAVREVGQADGVVWLVDAVKARAGDRLVADEATSRGE